MKQIEIPYIDNCTQVFQHFAQQPWAILLDSCRPYSTQGRFDILSTAPNVKLTTFGAETRIEHNGKIRLSTADPFELVKHQLKPIQDTYDLPFYGGAMGYFGYDLIRRQLALAQVQTPDLQLPDMAVGIYDWALITDHQLHKSFIVAIDTQLDLRHAQVKQALNDVQSTRSHFKLTRPFERNYDFAAYQQKFNAIQTHLRLGNCYQINLTQQFKAEYAGNPWDYYHDLRQKNPAPFAGFFNHPAITLLSLSPERFLKIKQGLVETKPIKGTRPRGQTKAQDLKLEQALKNSTKDRAENLMIVDLLRNDLSKVCRPGSVKVPQLFQLEKFANVMHLVSTVTGRLCKDQHPLDCLQVCFPGGSVTGTPKRSAIEIINSLEPHRRGPYCGAFGYIDHCGQMDMNIIIRSLFCQDKKIICYGGGAILTDSHCQQEYQEISDKIDFLLA